MRICYYDLLDLERQASPLDIKKAYRKQALIWHPDKNGDRVQEATDRFALIQEAYEVLSDPQERSWYDGHRDSILRGEDHSQKDSSAGTTAEDLMRYFSVSEFKGYEDTSKGFYNVYRSLFQKLVDEEEEASRQAPGDDDDDETHSYTEYPPFGNATTPFTDCDGYRGYGGYVRDFYGAWSNFSSCKSFIWMDKWKLSDAPSRYVRRAMEKENKKARETGRKEYNDTVRKLTEFVRKRDPRVKAYLVEEQKRKEAAAVEQKARIQREKQEWQAKISNYKEQDWAKVDQDDVLNEHDDDDDDDEEEDEIINDEFYCVVCDKSYKSEKQFASHEVSKRHLENVEILRQEMLADEENFEFGEADEDMDQGVPIDQGIPIDIDQGIPIDVNDMDVNDMDDEELTRQLEELELLEEEESQKDKKKKKKNKKKMTPRWGFDDEDDVSTATSVVNDEDEISMLTAALEEEKKGNNRRKKRGGNTKLVDVNDDDFSSPSSPPLETADPVEDQENTPEPEKESAKTKKEKRKEKKKLKEEIANTQSCNVCGEAFETRNQLFGHITETGHALALSGEYKKVKKGGKRR